MAVLTLNEEAAKAPSADCSDMDLTQIGDVSAASDTLRKLDLSINKLSNAALGPFAFPNLTWINLSNNSLTSLAGLENCPSLQILNLSHNNITSISGIRNFTKMKALIINNNAIAVLPDLTPLAANLNTLVLSHNKLTALPKPFPHLPQLKKLSVSNNSLTEYPVFMIPAPQIQELRLSHNKLSSLPRAPLAPKKPTSNKPAPKLTTTHTLPAVKTLDLGSNLIQFTTISDLTTALAFLAPNATLVNLNLKGNPVVDVEGYKEAVVQSCGNALKVLDGVRFDAKFLERREKRKESGWVEKQKVLREQQANGGNESDDAAAVVEKPTVSEKRVKRALEKDDNTKPSNVAKKIKISKPSSNAPDRPIKSHDRVVKPGSKVSSSSSTTTTSKPIPQKQKTNTLATATKPALFKPIETPQKKSSGDGFFLSSFKSSTPSTTTTLPTTTTAENRAISAAKTKHEKMLDKQEEQLRSGVVAVIDPTRQQSSKSKLTKTAASAVPRGTVVKSINVDDLEKSATVLAPVGGVAGGGTGLAPAWD
ncbi:hypothetical protein CcCBS67573_g04526 [Chytriomyces confervae]|uniref:U2A'/phosphoprotein 32 family A C-terminal domain-containing protein n=1 Tax=Chytriomyces confervae TaxID=246404 RepID=A0A507FD35_9FUNG|nr:hypothetical protein CcCBS67573_g04526 [Chytriomyces confervae]